MPPARVDPKFGLPTQLREGKAYRGLSETSRTKTQQAGRSASLSTRPECTNYKEGGWQVADLCSLQSQKTDSREGISL